MKAKRFKPSPFENRSSVRHEGKAESKCCLFEQINKSAHEPFAWPLLCIPLQCRGGPPQGSDGERQPAKARLLSVAWRWTCEARLRMRCKWRRGFWWTAGWHLRLLTDSHHQRNITSQRLGTSAGDLWRGGCHGDASPADIPPTIREAVIVQEKLSEQRPHSCKRIR